MNTFLDTYGVIFELYGVIARASQARIGKRKRSRDGLRSYFPVTLPERFTSSVKSTQHGGFDHEALGGGVWLAKLRSDDDNGRGDEAMKSKAFAWQGGTANALCDTKGD